MSVYQGVRNVSFSENFAYVLNGWPLIGVLFLPCIVFQKYHFQVDINKCYNELELSNYDLTYSIHIVPIAEKMFGKLCFIFFPLKGVMLFLLLVSRVITLVGIKLNR